MKKILFVCLGNICRSPLAEAIFNHKINRLGLIEEFQCDSAGTGDYHIGEIPDKRTIEIAHQHGMEVHHLAQQFKKHHAATFDYLIAMDESNYHNMVKEIGDEPDFIYKMRAFDPENKGADVPDPYFGGKEGFEHVYQILDRSMDHFINFLKKDKG